MPRGSRGTTPLFLNLSAVLEVYGLRQPPDHFTPGKDTHNQDVK